MVIKERLSEAASVIIPGADKKYGRIHWVRLIAAITEKTDNRVTIVSAAGDILRPFKIYNIATQR